VAVLCTLGARASPHHVRSPRLTAIWSSELTDKHMSLQALFGISTVHAEDGAPCPALFTATGNRREQVCRVLEHRARETAWSSGIYRQRTQDALAALVGLAQLSLREFPLPAHLSSPALICMVADEENPPDDSRCFVRQAAGLFVDIRADELAEGSISSLGGSLGCAIFVSSPSPASGAR
jgi:hypothetical protein